MIGKPEQFDANYDAMIQSFEGSGMYEAEKMMGDIVKAQVKMLEESFANNNPKHGKRFFVFGIVVFLVISTCLCYNVTCKTFIIIQTTEDL